MSSGKKYRSRFYYYAIQAKNNVNLRINAKLNKNGLVFASFAYVQVEISNIRFSVADTKKWSLK